MPERDDQSRSHPDGAIIVALVEDDRACRQALVAALEVCEDIHLAWQAATLEEARRQLTTPIDVLLVDLGLPDGSGLELIREIGVAQPNCAVMVSTMFADDEHLMAAVRAGALGYLLKDVSATAIPEEIRNLHSGGSPINPMMARKLLHRGFEGTSDTATPPDPAYDEPAGDTPVLQLSPRETQVLQLVARGHILEEVASVMGITRHTARSFVRRIYQKLQVRSRVEAVQLAIRHGLL